MADETTDEKAPVTAGRTYGGRAIVKRIEDGMDRRDVAATSYQMRNFYAQFRDGFFSRLDVMNYIQHNQCARWARPGNDVLDVCCGRGLMLPLLRYYQPKIASYTGLDLVASNAVWTSKRVTDGDPLASLDDYYPFSTAFVEGNAADADTLLAPRRFDCIIYTASIEHMHPDDGQRSLHALRAVAADDARLILTCPNTPEGQDGYDTKYRAHVYEWSLAELRAGLAAADWTVDDEWGLEMGVRDMEAAMTAAGHGDMFRRLRAFIPPDWLVPVLSPLFPESSGEVGLLCRPTAQQGSFDMAAPAPAAARPDVRTPDPDDDVLARIAEVLDRGIPDERKLATLTRIVHDARGQ